MVEQITTFEQVLAQTEMLTSREKIRLMEQLAASIETYMTETIAEARQRDWIATVERTAGSLADDPIERPPQLAYEVRESIE